MVAEDATEDVEEVIDALEVEVADAMTSQEVIDVLVIAEIEDLATEVIDVLLVLETEVIEDVQTIIEVTDARVIAEIDVQNLVALDLIDQDVLVDEINTQC